MSRGIVVREVEKRILTHLHGRHTRIHLKQIHAHLIRHHLHQSNHILSQFISVCRSLGNTNYAHLVFLHTKHPNILLYNSIIKAYSLASLPFYQISSLHMFHTMKKLGIWPDEFTFTPILKSCSNLCDVRFGKTIHGQVVSLGFHRFTSIGSGIVEVYVDCGIIGDAHKVFDEMPERNVIVFNLMIRGYSKIRNVDTGYNLFKKMKERSIVTWNTMLTGLTMNSRNDEALKLFHEMKSDRGRELDEATIVTMLPICARFGDDETGKWIHSYAKSSELFDKHVSVGNAIVDFYCKRGHLEVAYKVFDEMPRRNVVSWNTMISGMSFNGNGERGLDLFDEMFTSGMSPNESTFVGVLACCVHSGLVQKGRELFGSMVLRYGIEPKLEHYGCMVDLLGRGGFVKEAYDLVKSMPMRPNSAIWGALLSACRDIDDLEVAEEAIRELMVLEPWNSGNYVLLSNLYAENGKWNEVEKVRRLMMMNNVEKTPGQSLIM